VSSNLKVTVVFLLAPTLCINAVIAAYYVKERGMGQGNLNRPPRNAIKSTQLCVLLLLERTLPCS
jgi:hypothetical protein